ncbi:TPA: hypothetical protein DCQ44_00380, partial [Candidatus Taylorbacteria bacterium]|nr:hypothetical protein [Candidatus Taylorbacteria bacterium]
CIRDRYLSVFFLYFYSNTNNREQSKDLAQDTFVKTWNYYKAENEVQNVRALLYKIAKNTLVDWYRKRKNQSLDSMVETGFDPVDTEAGTETYSEVQN